MVFYVGRRARAPGPGLRGRAAATGASTGALAGKYRINTYFEMVFSTQPALGLASDIWGMQAEEYRRRLVQAALRLTEGTPMAAGPYERQLLERYVAGQLSIEEVVTLVEAALPAAPNPASC